MPRLLSLAVLLVPAVAVAAPLPAVSAVAYHPDGKVVAFGTHGEVRLFDAMTGEHRSTVKAGGRVTALAFNPKGTLLAVAAGEPGKDGTVQLVRIEKFATIAIPGHKDTVYAVAFSPDGKTLATAGYDRLIHLWDVPTDGTPPKAPRLTLKDHSDTVYGLAFHPGGNLLASAGADRAVKVWDAATGKRLYTLSDSTDWVYAVAWSPDGKHLAAGGVDRSVRVWAADKDGGKLVTSVFAHEKPVWRMAYNADGKTLYTTGEDGIIKAWDAAKLKETKVFPAQPHTLLAFALRPDGKQLAVGLFDGSALLLDAATGKSTARLLPPKDDATTVPPKQPPVPKPVSLTPTGGIPGKTTSVVVTGTDLHLTTKVTADADKVAVKFGPESFTPTAITLQVSIPTDTPTGTVKLTFEGAGGKSAPVAFAVDRFAAIAEAGVTDSARAAQTVKLPATLVGTIDRAGDADYYRFPATTGDQIGVQAITAELGSKLEPVVVLTDADGVILAEGTAVLGYRVAKSGTYAVGIRDRDYRGGADFGYRLHVGGVPVVTGVFPLGAQRGRTTDVHIDGVNLSANGAGIAARVTIPATAVPGSRFPVQVPDGSNRPLGKAEVIVDEFPAVVVAPTAGSDLRVPGSGDGILSKPGEPQTVRFAAKKGQRLVVEATARRAGSPVDPVIEILDADGKPVPRVLLRATAKVYVSFRDHDSIVPGIRLETWGDLAIDDYLFAGGELMRILALPRNPDDDCQFYQVAKERVGHLGTTPAFHAQGAPLYKVEFHPPGATLPPNGLPSFTLNYRNDDGGAGFGKDSMLMFDAPADGTYQVRVSDARGAGGPTHAYRVTVRPPRPDFTVTFTPTAPAVWKGGALPVAVTVARLDGFDGEVRVQLDGLPPGFSAPATFVEPGQTTTAFALHADATAKVPANTKIKLVARATIDGKEIVREAVGGLPSVAAVGDIVTRTRTAEIVIRPGAETRFTVDIERQGKFAGRVPLEVRGLPHGVRVLNVGLNGILVTERETSREVVLYAEPWVKPVEHPIVVLARREGVNTEHAAKSVLLKVEK